MGDQGHGPLLKVTIPTFGLGPGRTVPQSGISRGPLREDPSAGPDPYTQKSTSQSRPTFDDHDDLTRSVGLRFKPLDSLTGS